VGEAHLAHDRLADVGGLGVVEAVEANSFRFGDEVGDGTRVGFDGFGRGLEGVGFVIAQVIKGGDELVGFDLGGYGERSAESVASSLARRQLVQEAAG
jgi:hypothetical protein